MCLLWNSVTFSIQTVFGKKYFTQALVGVCSLSAVCQVKQLKVRWSAAAVLLKLTSAEIPTIHLGQLPVHQLPSHDVFTEETHVPHAWAGVKCSGWNWFSNLNLNKELNEIWAVKDGQTVITDVIQTHLKQQPTTCWTMTVTPNAILSTNLLWYDMIRFDMWYDMIIIIYVNKKY